eukprot:2206202-Rhodomonas_salina.3
MSSMARNLLSDWNPDTSEAVETPVPSSERSPRYCQIFEQRSWYQKQQPSKLASKLALGL